ncbi:MAG: DUF4256 domain-containing protein [Fimbriimonas sp.]
MSAEMYRELLDTLQSRFQKHPGRHPDLAWHEVRARLDASPDSLRTLQQMEQTGGEPDVVGQDPLTGQIVFFDCSAESPKGRRSLCYDLDALNSRKENKPQDSAVSMATAMGVELLTEDQYRWLQTTGRFDLKTSSWLKTPEKIRKLGGAIFGDCRYETVFVFHNGADSYYASRGFRGCLRV